MIAAESGTTPLPLDRYYRGLVLLWTALLGASLIFNVLQIRAKIREAARVHAQVAYTKDITYRAWKAMRGAVYVPVTKANPLNSYLKVPQHEVVTQDGKRLALVNPAYMTRQAHELEKSMPGARGHITSLKPLRPENAPDAWERQALLALARGAREVSEVQRLEGEEHMRLMRPLVTEKACLQCHAKQGYRVGDIRGGISVSIPMKSLEAISHEQLLLLSAGHGLLWVGGLVVFMLVRRRLGNSETARLRMEGELRVAKERAEAASHQTGAYLAGLLDNTSDMIVTLDTEGRVASFNRGGEAMLGYDRAEVIGRPLSVLHRDPEECADLLRRVEEREGLSGLDTQLLHKNGERVVNTQLTLSVLRDEDGEPVGFVGISRDVSEQKQLQGALIQSEKMAAMGKLAASVAHEINNPLTGILTFSESLAEDAPPDDPNIKDYELIFHEAMRCRDIVKELLDYSRLDKPHRVTTRVNRVIERSLNLVERQATFKDVTVELQLAESLPPSSLDPGQMQQVFLNLMINAVDAMERSGTLTIISGVAADDRLVEVSVRDTGCGIPARDIEKIFDPFYSTKGKHGNGLGLNVVQSIVGQHGGHMEVESVVGTGTVFYVRLPMVTLP